MSTSLRTLALALVLLIMGFLSASDVAALQARGATPQTTVRTMLARGGSAAAIAQQLKQQYRMEREQVARLLKESGFDGAAIDAALRSAFGDARGTAAQPRRAVTSAIPRAIRPGTRTTQPSTRAPQPATMSGPPPAVGPPKPSVSVSLVSMSPSHLATIEVSSSDAPTAMRMANNEAELRTAPWQPYQPNVNFTVNGFFPVQVVVQVGKPVGPAAHPVNGPHVVSDPVRTKNHNDNNSNHPWVRSYLRVVSWQAAAGSGGPPQSDFGYRDTEGTLTLRLDGLGDVEEIDVAQLEVCRPNYYVTEGPSRSVSKSGDGSFLIKVRGYVEFVPEWLSPHCRHQILLLGKGGNFAPGVSYTLHEADGFRFRDPPSQTTDQTFDFAYGPKMGVSGLPTSLATSGCQVSRGSGGRLTLEMRSGPVAGNCDFTSPAVYLPRGIDVTALHWRVDEFPSANSDSFHCKVVVIPSGATTTQWVVDPSETDFFNTTEGPFLPSADLPPPPPGENWSHAGTRDWVVPLRASMQCDAHIEVGAGLEVDRIRLVLDRIEYRALPWMM